MALLETPCEYFKTITKLIFISILRKSCKEFTFGGCEGNGNRYTIASKPKNGCIGNPLWIFQKQYKINFIFNFKEIMQRIHFWWLRRKRKSVHNPKWMWISHWFTFTLGSVPVSISFITTKSLSVSTWRNEGLDQKSVLSYLWLETLFEYFSKPLQN